MGIIGASGPLKGLPGIGRTLCRCKNTFKDYGRYLNEGPAKLFKSATHG